MSLKNSNSLIKIKYHFKKIRHLFNRYPIEFSENLELIKKSRTNKNIKKSGKLIAIQCVPNKFYFLLFNLIRKEFRFDLDPIVHLISIRAINGAMGDNWIAGIKRSSLVTWLWLRQWETLWGRDKDKVAYRTAAFYSPIRHFKDKAEAKKLHSLFASQTGNFNLKIDGIEIGDLIVDSYLRFKPAPRFQPKDKFVQTLIKQALSDVRQADKYFSKYSPDAYISSYSSYIEHGVAVRVALKYKVPVYTFGDLARFSKRLTSEDSFHTIDYSKFKTDFEELSNQDLRLEEARKQLEIRLHGGIDIGTAYMKKSAYINVDAEIPRDISGAVVIFLHDFYDSYNAYGNLIFDDFWDWICCTIETLQSANIKFYLKPHPNQIDLSDAVLSSLREKYPLAKWLPFNFSNLQLVSAGIICGVTAYGTVAHELAYLGIPTIGYGLHPHCSFDFCRTAKSKNEYIDMLRLPGHHPVDIKEMRRQSLMFYYMRNLVGSAEEINLRKSFIDLWKACNVNNANDQEIEKLTLNLQAEPLFKSFVRGILSS